MKKILFFLILLISIGILPSSYAESGESIYVSVTGNDKNDGSFNKPAATLKRALEIYAGKKSLNNEYTATIYMHGGIYRVHETLNMTALHSGITIAPYGDGEVKIRGSVKLGEFKKVTDSSVLDKVGDKAKENLYETDLSAFLDSIDKYPEYAVQGSGTGYYELYVNNECKTLARWPNGGYAVTGDSIDGISFNTMQERAKKWGKSKYGMVWGYWRYDWAGQPIYISSVDDNSLLTLSKMPEYGLAGGQRYYAFNMLEELDMPGEYYIDRDAKKLYYYPDSPIDESEIELSVMKSNFITANNLQNAVIKNITFELSRGSGIYASASRNLSVNGVIVRNMGNYAISVSGTKCFVENCTVFNLGGAGISINGGNTADLSAGENIVRNNHVYNFGRIFRTYQSGISVNGSGNKMLYNTVHDSPHRAVTISGADNEFAYNEIYDVVKDTSDSGAFYSGRDWRQWGKSIHDNYFHDISRNEEINVSSVACVYADDMLCGTWVYNNIFENCDLPMLAGGGSDNTFTDNILINCKKSIQYDDRGVRGNWANNWLLPGTNEQTLYDRFIEFIDNTADIQLWKDKFPNFSVLLSDVNKNRGRDCDGNVILQEEVDIGIPKNAKVGGNINYGRYVNDSSYYDIADVAAEYGDVNTANEERYINIPQNIVKDNFGAENVNVNSMLSVVYPVNEEIVSEKNIRFTWNKVPGYSDYSIVVKNGDETVFRTNTKNTYAEVQGLKNGRYTWTVTAYDTNAEALTASSVFAVQRDFDIKTNNVYLTDFEEFKDGTKFVGGAETKTWFLGDYVTLAITGDGNSAVIESDPYTNSKALKLIYSGSGSIEIDNWFSGNSKQNNLSADSVVRAGYTSRIEHYASNAFLYRFNAFTNKNDWYGIARIHGYNNTLILNRGTGAFLPIKRELDSNPEQWFESSMTYNSVNQYTAVETNGEKTAEHIGGTKQPIARASFVIKEAEGGFANGMSGDFSNYYGKGSADKPTVIWLDNLEFELLNEIDVKKECIYADSGIECNVKVNNYSDNDRIYDCIAALYSTDENGCERLERVMIDKDNIVKCYNKEEAEHKFLFDGYNDKKYKCRVYLWESMKSMKPINQVKD